VPPKSLVGDWKVLFVPSLVASLVAANQKNCHATGVKGEEDTSGIASKLHPQFLHLGERRNLKRIDVGRAKLRPALSQQVCVGDYLTPQLGFQPGELCGEIVIKLYIPFHWELLFHTWNVFHLWNDIKRNNGNRLLSSAVFGTLSTELFGMVHACLPTAYRHGRRTGGFRLRQLGWAVMVTSITPITLLMSATRGIIPKLPEELLVRKHAHDESQEPSRDHPDGRDGHVEQGLSPGPGSADPPDDPPEDGAADCGKDEKEPEDDTHDGGLSKKRGNAWLLLRRATPLSIFFA
jgi:hypothetical protein